jgi:predicted HTH transcriptional regulator
MKMGIQSFFFHLITNNFFFKKEGFSKTLSNINLCVFINQNGQIYNREVREKFKFSNWTALDEINKLIELKLLKPKGKGRTLHYKNRVCLIKLYR